MWQILSQEESQSYLLQNVIKILGLSESRVAINRKLTIRNGYHSFASINHC